MKRGHSDVTKWKYYCKGRNIWERTCEQMGSWGRHWLTHFEGCPTDCLLLENKPVTTDNNQWDEKWTEKKTRIHFHLKWNLWLYKFSSHGCHVYIKRWSKDNPVWTQLCLRCSNIKLSSNCCFSSSHKDENEFESKFVKFKLDRKDKIVVSMTGHRVFSKTNSKHRLEDFFISKFIPFLLLGLKMT